MSEDVPQVVLQVPVALPDAARIEEIFRDAAVQAAEKHLNWLSLEEAAEYVKMPRRTFERKRKQFRLPHSEMGGVKRIWRADLDAMLLVRMVVPAGQQIIEFPSLALRAEALKRPKNAA